MNVQTLMIVCVRTKQRNILIVFSKFRDWHVSLSPWLWNS